MGFLEATILAIDQMTLEYITKSVQGVMAYISGPFYALMGTYIALWGFAHFMNLVKEPIPEAVKRFLKVFAIITMALHWGSYNEYIVVIFTQVPGEMAGVFLNAKGISMGTTGGTTSNVATALDALFSRMWAIGAAYWQKGQGKATIVPEICAILVYLLTILVTAYATTRLPYLTAPCGTAPQWLVAAKRRRCNVASLLFP
jgi:hypothetical protein